MRSTLQGACRRRAGRFAFDRSCGCAVNRTPVADAHSSPGCFINARDSPCAVGPRVPLRCAPCHIKAYPRPQRCDDRIAVHTDGASLSANASVRRRALSPVATRGLKYACGASVVTSLRRARAGYAEVAEGEVVFDRVVRIEASERSGDLLRRPPTRILPLRQAQVVSDALNMRVDRNDKLRRLDRP